jgi:WD40 repeat protein
MSNFKNKYLKYKSKYLQLKKQLGSGITASYTIDKITLEYEDTLGAKKNIIYTVKEKVGNGSFGVVYKLVKDDDGAEFILKIGANSFDEGIHSDWLLDIIDNDMLVLFQGKEPEEFLIAKYNGNDLQKEYFKNLPKIKNEFNSTITQILQLLSKINKRGLYHSDIKLENITIKNNKVYLIDFGFLTKESNIASFESNSIYSITPDDYNELKKKFKNTDIFGFFYVCIDLLFLYYSANYSLFDILLNIFRSTEITKLFYLYYYILPKDYRTNTTLNNIYIILYYFDTKFPSFEKSRQIFCDFNPQHTNLFRFMAFIYDKLIVIPDVYRIDRNNFIIFLRVLSDCLLPDFDYDLFIPKFKAAVNLLFQNNLENGFAINSVAFSPLGTLLAIGLDNGTVNLWSISLENSSSRLEDTNELLYHRVTSLVFHPSSHFVVTSYSNFDETVGIIKLWRILNEKLVEYLIIDPCIFVFSIRFNLTGNILATSCSDGTVKLWSILYSENPSAVCDVVLDKHSNYAISVGFDPTGTLIATGYDDGIVKIWIILKDKKLVEFVTDIKKYINDEELVNQEGFHNAVMAVEFNPKGSLLVAGYNDGTYTIWNISKDKKLFVVKFNIKNNKPVKSVIFHQTLPFMAICYENIVKICGIKNEDSPPYDVLNIEWYDYFNYIAFHPTEPVLVTASTDHTAKLWYFPTE